jgi:DNA-binding winged helix-turn-helix (wHTH) protein/tetratricopeptide (TPR) repeat protein
VQLTGKSFAVLRHLADRSGQLVRKEELFQNVWPTTIVCDTTLTTCIKELRRVLDDDARAPRYIETVHRRGYRFIAPLISRPPVANIQYSVVSSQEQSRVQDRASSAQGLHFAFCIPQFAMPLVGRAAELAQLHKRLADALTGERQVVFVTGDPGIGKTSLVEAFLSGLRQQGTGNGEQTGGNPTQRRTAPVQPLNVQSLMPNLWIGQGQCIEHYGAGEAYLPVFEALGRLGRGAEGEEVIQALHRYAPTWLAQMPAFLSVAERDHLQQQVRGVTHERMLREMAEAIEALTSAHPLVLVLEDMHWSDASTLELLAVLARRCEPARLLVIATYRPMEMLAETHLLKSVVHELHAHSLCVELVVQALDEEAVESYLVTRLQDLPVPMVENGQKRIEPCAALSSGLVSTFYARTEGHPLFLASLTDDLMTQGALTRDGDEWALHGDGTVLGIPESMRQLVARQRDRLSADEQRVLEAASIVGVEFSAAAVAAALKTDTVAIERWCERLAERQYFLRRVGVAEWPDGSVAARYHFRHALHQELWRERVCPTQFQQFHLMVGERKERAYGERAPEIAVELAVHFEQGRDYPRAVRYLRHAGDTASARSAHQEAISHLTRALELLTFLPDTPERAQQELSLHLTLITPLIAARGYAAPEVEIACNRAQALCRQVGETRQLFPVLGGLQAVYYNRAEFHTALELAEQMLRLAQRSPEPVFLLWAHYTLGFTLARQGELVAARTHLEQSLALYDPRKPDGYGYVQDPGVTCLVLLAHVLSSLGYPNQAKKRSQAALALARELSHPYSLALVLGLAAELEGRQGERRAAQALAESAIALSREQGFSLRVAVHTFYLGWLLVMRGETETGLVQMRQELLTLQSMGANRGWRLVRLAEAYGQAKQSEEGLRIVSEALTAVDDTGEHWEEGELYRLKGELLLQAGRIQRNGKSVQRSSCRAD